MWHQKTFLVSGVRWINEAFQEKTIQALTVDKHKSKKIVGKFDKVIVFFYF